MKIKIRKLLFFLLLAQVLLSCSDNGFSDNVVSSDGAVNDFEEMLILLNVKTEEGAYLAVESIDEVNIYVNSTHWATISSEVVDLNKVDKYEEGNRYLTSDKINYLLLGKQTVKEEPSYETAGEVADYLNGVQLLTAGDYLCFIESFQVTFNDGTIKKYYPMKYKPFKVEDNVRSAYVGEIELTID